MTKHVLQEGAHWYITSRVSGVGIACHGSKATKLMMSFVVLLVLLRSRASVLMVSLVVLLILLRGRTSVLVMSLVVLLVLRGSVAGVLMVSLVVLLVLLSSRASVLMMSFVVLLVFRRSVAGVMMLMRVGVGDGASNMVSFVSIFCIVYRNVADSDVWDDSCCDNAEEDERDKRLVETHDEKKMVEWNTNQRIGGFSD